MGSPPTSATFDRVRPHQPSPDATPAAAPGVRRPTACTTGSVAGVGAPPPPAAPFAGRRVPVRLVVAPPVLRDRADAAELCRQIQHDPTSADLVLDFCCVEILHAEAARCIADHVCWRVHWSRVGCIVTDTDVAATLAALHLDRIAVFGRTPLDVALAIEADDREPDGGRLLIMGPGPVTAA